MTDALPRCREVVNHYDTQFKLDPSDAQKSDLVEYLKGI